MIETNKHGPLENAPKVHDCLAVGDRQVGGGGSTRVVFEERNRARESERASERARESEREGEEGERGGGSEKSDEGKIRGPGS